MIQHLQPMPQQLQQMTHHHRPLLRLLVQQSVEILPLQPIPQQVQPMTQHLQPAIHLFRQSLLVQPLSGDTASPTDATATPTKTPSNITPSVSPITARPTVSGDTASPTDATATPTKTPSNITPSPTKKPSVSPITARPTESVEILPSDVTTSPTARPTVSENTVSPTAHPTASGETLSPTTAQPTVAGNTVSPTAAQPTAANTISPTERQDCDEDDSLGRTDCDDDDAPPSGQCSVLITMRFEVCYIEPYKNRRGILWTNVKACACNDVFEGSELDDGVEKNCYVSKYFYANPSGSYDEYVNDVVHDCALQSVFKISVGLYHSDCAYVEQIAQWLLDEGDDLNDVLSECNLHKSGLQSLSYSKGFGRVSNTSVVIKLRDENGDSNEIDVQVSSCVMYHVTSIMFLVVSVFVSNY
eukprot:478669_1